MASRQTKEMFFDLLWSLCRTSTAPLRRSSRAPCSLMFTLQRTSDGPSTLVSSSESPLPFIRSVETVVSTAPNPAHIGTAKGILCSCIMVCYHFWLLDHKEDIKDSWKNHQSFSPLLQTLPPHAASTNPPAVWMTAWASCMEQGSWKNRNKMKGWGKIIVVN